MRKGKRERLRRKRSKICVANHRVNSLLKSKRIIIPTEPLIGTTLRIRLPLDYWGLDPAKGRDLTVSHLIEHGKILAQALEKMREKLPLDMRDPDSGYNGWRTPTPPPVAPLPTFVAPSGEALASSWADADSYFNKKSST